MSALRHIAAIRTRLLSSPELTAIVGQNIYLGHVFNVRTPSYPAITIRQAEGNLGVWANRIIDPARILVDCYSKKDVEEPSTIEELVESLLHVQKTLTSSDGACFHEIRKVQWNTAFWDSDTGAWRVAAMYLVRVSIL